MKASSFAVVAIAAVLGTLVGCSSPTGSSSSSGSSGSTTTTSTVYELAQNPSTAWPTVKFAVEPLSGKTITGATVLYAVDANALSYGFWAQWEFDSSSNYYSFSSLATVAKTWTTSPNVTSDSAFSSATSYVAFDFGYNTGAVSTVWVKQVNLTYSDSSTETLTFTTTSASPVHSVAVSGSTSTPTDVTFSSRFWISDYASSTNLASGLTSTVTTVSF